MNEQPTCARCEQPGKVLQPDGSHSGDIVPLCVEHAQENQQALRQKRATQQGA